MITIHARNFTPGGLVARAVDLVVIHTTEGELHPGAAQNVAAWFAGPNAPQASTHYVVDCRDVVACVAEEDIAWAAPGANPQGIHLELCGRAAWTAEDWNGGHARAMLERAAALVADICARWQIPRRRLSVDELRAGARGACGHVDVSQAWRRSDHWDPGPAFPWGVLLGG